MNWSAFLLAVYIPFLNPVLHGVCVVGCWVLQTAILNANYMAKRLDGHYNVVFRGKKGQVCVRV